MMPATSISLCVRAEFDNALVEADGSDCPVCQDPMFGEMVAVRVFTAVGNTPLSLAGTFPVCCPSCAGDERLMRLPCKPEDFSPSGWI